MSDAAVQRASTQRRDARAAYSAADASDAACRGDCRCAVLDGCKGCPWVDIPYDEQIRRKQRMLEELFGAWCTPDPIIAMERPEGYRNKFMVPFARSATGTSFFGLYAPTPQGAPLLDADACIAIDPATKPVLRALAELMHPELIARTPGVACPGAPVDVVRPAAGADTAMRNPLAGRIRHAVVRSACSSGQIMVTLVCDEPVFSPGDAFVRELLARCPEVATVVQNVNDGPASAVFGACDEVLHGPGYLEDALCGCRLRLSPRAFYQNNRILTERLYEEAVGMADLESSDTVLDAYCGIGIIGIVAARRSGCALIGVESNDVALCDARHNARINGIDEASFVCGDAATVPLERPVDVVFLDPPRKGADPRFLRMLSEAGPRAIVYISCNPQTQKRDIALLREEGWGLMALRAVDMFPHTPHVETVALLSR